MGFVFSIRCTPGPFTASDQEERARGVEAVTGVLPNIKEAEVTFGFVGLDVPESQVEEVVGRALSIVKPLRDRCALVVKGAEDQTEQRTRILREIRRALTC